MKNSQSKDGTSTPMMKQYLSIKGQHPDAILFFRMGDFYEMFMEDAVCAADVLKIALTSRDKGKDDSVPMCGIPYHAAQGYLNKLVQAGHKVAICEQVEDPRKARGLVKREVTRVVTPGTAVEETLLDATEPSYLASVVVSDEEAGLALVDVSTGEFRVLQLTGDDVLGELETVLAQFSPREILLPENAGTFQGGGHITRLEGYRFKPDLGDETLRNFFGVRTLAGFGIESNSLAVGAAGAALSYLEQVHQSGLKHIRGPVPLYPAENLILDETTLTNLEITRVVPGGEKDGSLFHLMNVTVTPQGARQLREVLVRPLKSVERIEARLDLVDEMVSDVVLRGKIRGILKKMSDVHRILSRVSSRTASPRDLGALRDTLEQIPALRTLLSELDSNLGKDINQRVHDLEDLRTLLIKAIVDNPPNVIKDGGVIREGYDNELDELVTLSTDGKSFISSLESREREQTKIPSLKVGFNRVFGYYLEVTNTHRELVPEHYVRKQTLVNAERFITQELKEMEDSILSAQERLLRREKELFDGICDQILRFIGELQETAASIAESDLFSALAELAHNMSYERPVVLENDPERRMAISAGRHPVLERINLEESFVPNDSYLDSTDSRLLIITGPNMAGKSTYMRQVALIVIMAQAGSFVPATEAIISPVDRVFTRIGASDVLTKGLSTFMVEMVETAAILNNATPDSLIILDEIGRGTSTFDGISIAWAMAEYLLEGTRQGCRTMFATHYHELTELALTVEGVRNFNVAIREWGDKLVFLRSVKEGPSDKSYGIQVARLAGLPEDVIARAKTILQNLEDMAIDRKGRPAIVAGSGEGLLPVNDPVLPKPQMDLFSSAGKKLLEEISSIDLDGMAPIEALNYLADLKRRYSEDED